MGNTQLHMCPKRSQKPSIRNYSQIEKEVLALVFGVKCFYKYSTLYGHKFKLVTHIYVGSNCEAPPIAAAHTQRWEFYA